MKKTVGKSEKIWYDKYIGQNWEFPCPKERFLSYKGGLPC